MSRSAAQQLAHWARIGRELEASDSVSHRDIAQVLTGRQEYDALNPREQAIVRAEWAERLRTRLGEADLARTFAERGQSYVELDGKGEVVRREPPRRRRAAG